jgi:hypothetical protein
MKEKAWQYGTVRGIGQTTIFRGEGQAKRVLETGDIITSLVP